jgi:hypothetical protein
LSSDWPAACGEETDRNRKALVASASTTTEVARIRNRMEVAAGREAFIDRREVESLYG